MFSKKEVTKKNFDLEDYKNVKSLENSLKKLYPVGSDANEMIENMKKAGARCVGIGGFIFRGRAKIIDNNMTSCELPKKESGLFYEWDWAINIFKDNKNRIKSITVDRKYFGV